MTQNAINMNTDSTPREGEDIKFVPVRPRVQAKCEVHESVTPFELHTDHGVYFIRVWRTELTPFSLGDLVALRDATKHLSGPTKIVSRPEMVAEIAKILGAIERVSAVEVLVADTGRGIVWYPDWC